jgi:signal transduction histidine kinase
MDTIRIIFLQNEPIIHFGYGLSFFVMGLAIALKSRSSSRLALARSLAWLAAFGLLYSLYEWGELFSPIQEAYLSPVGIEILHTIHLTFLSLSFVCLLEFGVALLRPSWRGQWLHWATTAWFGFYAVFAFLVLPAYVNEASTWHDLSNALARYTIGFPGGLLAAYGLREQTFRQIMPLQAPHIVSMLRIAGIALALFAVLGGLFPPPVPYFPGRWLNANAFERLLGVPPLVFQAVIGVVLVVTVIRSLEIFQVETERRIELMEQGQILAAERERIGRELHDKTIQTAYTTGLLVDSARKLAEPESEIGTRLDRAVLALNEVIQDLRHSMGELREVPDHEPLAEALESIANDPRYRSLVEIKLEMTLPDDQQLAFRETSHVLAIVNEALSNVVRHARARQVRLMAEVEDERFQLVIRDDGSGLPPDTSQGYGLRNMHERALLLGGELKIKGAPGKGTTVSLEMPWREE